MKRFISLTRWESRDFGLAINHLKPFCPSGYGAPARPDKPRACTGVSRTARVGQFVLACVAAGLILAGIPARAATRIWTGAHVTSSDWSRDDNWDTAAPANGDTVVFPAGAARLTNTNDLAGLQLAVIRFIGVGGDYTLGGNGVTLTDGIAAENTTNANIVDLARITLGADARFSVAQVDATLTINSEVRLGGFDLTCNVTGDLVLDGVISGNGNLTKEDAGTLRLAGSSDNTYVGRTRVNAGTLELDKGTVGGIAVPGLLVIGDGVGGSQSDVVRNRKANQVSQVTVNSSGLWALGNFANEVSELTLNEGGDVTTGATGKLILGSGAGIIVTPAADTPPDLSFVSGFLELSGGTHVITMAENTAPLIDLNELVIDAVISDVSFGGFTKEGAGDLQLSGNNTFGGQVIVNGGEVRLGHASALGVVGTVGVTTVNNDATLRMLDGVAVGDEVLRLNSTGTTSPGAGDPALRGGGTSSWSGDIALQRDTRIGVAPGGDFTLRGVISGTGNIIKENTGTLRFAGANPNTFTGDLLVNAGTLELDKGTIGGVVAVPGLLVIGDEVGGEHADVVRNLKDNQVSRVTVNGSGLWDLGGFEDEVSDLLFNDGGYVTTATNGLLRLGINADVNVLGDFWVGVGGPEISGNLELMAGTHTFTVENTSTSPLGGLTIEAFVTGEGAIEKAGTDTMYLRKSNSFAGPVTINQGSLFVSHGSALGSTNSGTRVNNDARLVLDIGVNSDPDIDNEPLTVNSTVASYLDTLVCFESNSWSGDVMLLSNARFHVNDGMLLDLRGSISGTGGVTKEGAGSLTFSGNSANTYAGSTIVIEGRLDLNKVGVNVAVPGALSIGDGVGGANADVVECLSLYEIALISAVTVASSGQFIAGQELIGALAGAGNVVIDSSLSAGNNNASTAFDGVISGAGDFTKYGAGTLTFNGDNTYSGDTRIEGGKLLVNGQQPASSVFIDLGGTLGGSGRVGNLSMYPILATVSPGASPGRLTVGNLEFGIDSTFLVELDGPTVGVNHDQLRALGIVYLFGANLQGTLNFIPTLGQPLVIIDNDGADDVIDQFNGLSEGDTLRLNQIPFIISYEGGDGNDVTLTATNTSISIVNTRIEAGNGNGLIEPNECNHIFIALMNETGGPLAVSHVVLDSTTPGVIVTQQESDYANFGALGIRTNTVPFQFRTTPDFECGRLAEFALTLTVSGSGTFTIPFAVPSGSGGPPVRFDNGANLALVDNGLTTSTLTVASAAPHVGKVAVSLHITHPSAGDLVLRLRSPSGNTVRLASNLGGTTDNYGTGCGNDTNRTTFDDAAPIRIAAGTAPFVGSFTPEEPLAAFLGENPNGDWQLLINDTVAGDTGELRCWSLFISPPECGDGGGACESCVPALAGSFLGNGPTATQRLVQDGVPSGCGSPKTCPGTVARPARSYRTHTITNDGPATCVTVALTELCLGNTNRFHIAAYLGSYDPANPCANYLGDSGGGLFGAANYFSFPAPANAVIVLVVNELTSQSGCEFYTLRLFGLPCPPPTLHISQTANPGEVRLFWSTAYPEFDLQRTPNLNGAGPYPFLNVPFTPIVVNGDYSVTNATTGDAAYFRLRKP